MNSGNTWENYSLQTKSIIVMHNPLKKYHCQRCYKKQGEARWKYFIVITKCIKYTF